MERTFMKYLLEIGGTGPNRIENYVLLWPKSNQYYKYYLGFIIESPQVRSCCLYHEQNISIQTRKLQQIFPSTYLNRLKCYGEKF